MEIGDHPFPRYEVGAPKGFNDLVTQIVQDWFNHAGYDWQERLDLDYRLNLGA